MLAIDGVQGSKSTEMKTILRRAATGSLRSRFLGWLLLALASAGAAQGGVITNIGGTVATGSTLASSNAALQNFDNTGSFSPGPRNSVSFVMSAGTTSTNVTISSAGAPSGLNRGSEFRIGSGLGPTYGASTVGGVGSLSGQYLQTFSGGNVSDPASFIRTLTITFSPAVSHFLIDYFDNNSSGSGPTANVMRVNDGSTAFTLALQNCNALQTCAGTGRQIGFAVDSTVTQINSVTFTFNGPDQSALNGGDLVIFDNLRVAGSIAQTGPSGAGKMINIATRGKVGTGSEIMIAGFVVEGAPRRVLIRGVGPTLGALGVPGALADPFLTLLRGETVVATNDDWGQAANAGAIRTAAASSGAFVLADSSLDACMLIDLSPGNYTAQVSGVNKSGATANTNTTGVALVEVYEVR